MARPLQPDDLLSTSLSDIEQYMLSEGEPPFSECGLGQRVYALLEEHPDLTMEGFGEYAKVDPILAQLSLLCLVYSEPRKRLSNTCKTMAIENCLPHPEHCGVLWSVFGNKIPPQFRLEIEGKSPAKWRRRGAKMRDESNLIVPGEDL